MRLLALLMISVLGLAGCGSSGGSSSSDDTVSTSPTDGSGDTTTPVDDSDPVTTDPSDSDDFATEMLAAVNAYRTAGAVCGGETMPAVPELEWDYSLEQAAFIHSSDMANGDFMSHTGSDGSSASDRVTAQGYSWSTVGENVAAGQQSVTAVMTSWMNSDGHCRNIMSENYTQMGASFVENSDTTYGIYWTQVFATPL